eukprot:353037-Chlamydomonas_euryale.AAC.11
MKPMIVLCTTCQVKCHAWGGDTSRSMPSHSNASYCRQAQQAGCLAADRNAHEHHFMCNDRFRDAV